ncbi:MAG: ubiquinone/menaquinone biosynthesis methyltransferase [Candidatus Neomarinimicrobiota bacterium]
MSQDIKNYPSVSEMSENQRIRIVKNIFSTVTGKYDLLNRFLSLRRDVAWRKRAVVEMKFFNTLRFLDVASGTGDLALDCARLYPGVKITGIDFVPEMVTEAQKKVRKENLGSRVEIQMGDATDLKFESNQFDVSAMAFGIRNIPQKVKALSEMTRITVPGGQVMILELTTPEPGLRLSIYRFYLMGLLPKIARLFTKNPSAYEYLGDSILNFPTRSEFMALMTSIGLREVRAIPLTFGICTLYIGLK